MAEIAKRWDVFISHASEDKEDVATPLARCLQQAGLQIWLDQQELKLGDSLREKIEHALSQSRYGVVILSPVFLAKGWPKRELSGLMALEEEGRKVILPVWHGITRAELTSHSPILADRLSISTDMGIRAVADAILKVVLSADSDSISSVSPSVSRRLLNLLDRPSSPEEVINFLTYHPQVLTAAGPLNSAIMRTTIKSGESVVPLATVSYSGTSGNANVIFFDFAEISGPLLIGGEAALGDDVVDRLTTLTTALQSAHEHPLEVGRQIEDIPEGIEPDELRKSTWYSAILFARRRELLSPEERGYLARRAVPFSTVTIRTYDTLVEWAIAIEGK